MGRFVRGWLRLLEHSEATYIGSSSNEAGAINQLMTDFGEPSPRVDIFFGRGQDFTTGSSVVACRRSETRLPIIRFQLRHLIIFLPLQRSTTSSGELLR